MVEEPLGGPGFVAGARSRYTTPIGPRLLMDAVQAQQNYLRRRAREPERVGFVEPHHRADRVAEPHGAARLRAPVRGRECIAAARQRGALRARDEQWRAAAAGGGAAIKGNRLEILFDLYKSRSTTSRRQQKNWL